MLTEAETTGRTAAELGTQYERTVKRHVEDLRALVQAEIDSRAEHERFIAESRERERKMLKAIAALEGSDMRVSTAAPPKAKAKTPPSRRLPAEAAITKVHDTFKRLREEGQTEVTQAQMTAAVDLSKETARRAIHALREREVVRVTRREGAGRTSKTFYALMPDA